MKPTLKDVNLYRNYLQLQDVHHEIKLGLEEFLTNTPVDPHYLLEGFENIDPENILGWVCDTEWASDDQGGGDDYVYGVRLAFPKGTVYLNFDNAERFFDRTSFDVWYVVEEYLEILKQHKPNFELEKVV